MHLHHGTIHRLALTGAAGMSGIALFDAATVALTGHSSVFSAESSVPWLMHAGDLVHGLAYVALVGVLVLHRKRISAVNRVARASLWVVMASLVCLAVGFLVLLPALGVDDLPGPVTAVVGSAFAGMLLGGPVLGIAVRRDREMRPGSIVLMTMVPLFAITVLLGFVAPDAAHPAYLETALAFGIALLGHRPATRTAGDPAGVTTPVAA